MKDVQISKRYNRGVFVGWKKYIGGIHISLVTGTDAAAKKQAVKLAAGLVAQHKLTKLAGGTWGKETIDQCRAMILGTPAEVVVEPLPQSSRWPVKAYVMLYDSMERYKQWQRARCDSGEISVDAYSSIAERIDKAKEGISNRPLSDVGLTDLATLRQYFTKRPVSKFGKPLAVQTVVNTVAAARAFFAWSRRYAGWNAPQFWEDEFKVNPKKLRDPQEKRIKAKGFDNFTLTELQVLWHFATPFARLMIGLGYWCGWTQKEIAMLLRDDIIEKDGDTYIDRLRHKTEVRGLWWIPPEVAVLLKRFVADTPVNTMGMALLGARGNPIVHSHIGPDGRKMKSDLVHCLWNRLRLRATSSGVRVLSFKYLRKSASQKVRDKLSREYAQLFCAQVSETVADESYNRASFDRLEKAVREIHAEMKQMFQPIDLRQLKNATGATGGASEGGKLTQTDEGANAPADSTHVLETFITAA